MQLFYSKERQGDFLILGEEESKHCVRVLRKKEGDIVHILDGEGGFYKGSIHDANKNKTIIEVLEEEQQEDYPGQLTHIALAPTKNISRVEWFMEKATEIGIGRFSFFFSQHSERMKLRYDRLEKVIQSACKQSLKAFFPKMDESMPFQAFVDSMKDFEGQKYIAHCQPGNKSLLRDVHKRGEACLILIGPEGDFSADEVQLAENNGFIAISLGEARLRTETAALVACHSIQFLEM